MFSDQKETRWIVSLSKQLLANEKSAVSAHRLMWNQKSVHDLSKEFGNHVKQKQVSACGVNFP